VPPATCLERTFRPRHPVNLRLTLGPLARGPFDSSLRFERGSAGAVWRATRTPDGPATTHLAVAPQSGEVRVRAWGPGAGWALEAAPDLVGGHDDDRGFAGRHPVISELHRRLPGLRIPRSMAVIEALVPIVMEQKVLGIDAKRSYDLLVRALGEPAPGPAEGLLVPPSAASVAATPSWAMHPWHVERKRADTIRRACSHAKRLEEAVFMAPDDARRRLTALPGLGPWTAAKVALVALGDADAVPIGDYHLPHAVSWALAGQPRGDDATMLELLEPYRGHRGRVIRLLTAGGVGAPRYGPRLARHAIGHL
jgi:3-methyladenine DNA glycosylase/8-oxoguanine DNA glycosylase